MEFIMLTAMNRERVIVKTERIKCVTSAITHSVIFFVDDFMEVLEDVETIYKMLEEKAK